MTIKQFFNKDFILAIIGSTAVGIVQGLKHTPFDIVGFIVISIGGGLVARTTTYILWDNKEKR